MQFEVIASIVAKSLEGQPDIGQEDQNAFFCVRGDIPATLAFIKEIDGLLWFEQRIMLGVVKEPSDVPLHTLLYENRRRDSVFFLQDIKDVTWLGLKDRYALPSAISDQEIAEILTVRFTGMIGFQQWAIGGIEFMPGL